MPRFRLFISTLISSALFGLLPLGQYAAWAECPTPGEGVLVPTFCVTSTGDVAGGSEVTLRDAVTSANLETSSEIRFRSDIYADGIAEIKLTSPLEITSNVQIIGPELKAVEGEPVPQPQILISRDSGMAVGSSMIEISQNVEVKIEGVSLNSAGGAGHAIEVKEEAEGETDSVLTVEKSVIKNANSDSSGGAISTPGTVNIIESTIENNHSEGDGGAISAGGDVNVVNSTITNNSALGNGGAIQSEFNVAISNTLMENNSSSGAGGGVAAEGDVTVSYSGILDNTASSDGGAIYAMGDIRVEDDSLVDGNRSLNGEGGALKSEGTVTVLFSEISNNQSGSSGGAISAPQVLVNVEVVLIESEPVLVAATPMGDGPSSATFTGNSAGNKPDVTDTDEVDFRDDFNQRAGSGGAISAETVTTSQATFVSNTAIAGGAISVSDNVDISNSSFHANIANDGYGGAIDIDDFSSANSSIVNSTFNGNTAGDGGAIDGNGMVDVEGTELEPRLIVEGSTFSGNQAEGSGGAIYHIGKIEVSDSDFTSNSAEGRDGGAIYAENTAQITDSTFIDNHAGGNGGAISAGDSVEVTNSTFNENSTGERGGAIYANDDVSIASSSFGDNLSLNGGAIYAENTAQITDSTFIGNQAGENGGAISTGIALVNSSLFSSNSAANGGALEIFNESIIIDITENMGEPNPEIIECLGDLDAIEPEDLVSVYICLWNFNKVGNSVVMNSLFDENSSTEKGSAIFGATWLLFNTLSDNFSENGGSSIDLRSNLMTMLLGNLIISSNPEPLCAIPFDFSLRNLVSDESCTSMEDSLAELSGSLDPEMLSLLANPYMAGSERGIVPISLLEGLSMSLLTPMDFHLLVRLWLSELRGIENPLELLLPGSLQDAQLNYMHYFTSDEFVANSEDHVARSDELRNGELDLIRGILALILGMSSPNPGLEDPYSALEPTSQSVWRNAGRFIAFISEHISRDFMGNNRLVDGAWSAGAIETTLGSMDDESESESDSGPGYIEAQDDGKELLPQATNHQNWNQQTRDEMNWKLAEAERARLAAQEARDKAKKEAKLDRAKKRESLRAKTLEISTKVRATRTSNVKVSVKVQFNKGLKRANRFGAVAV